MTAGIIGFTRAMSEELTARSGVPRERLPLSASHTHSAPVAGQLERAELHAQSTDKVASRRNSARYLLGVLDRDGKLPGSYRYPVAVWQFGKGLRWIVSAYSNEFRGYIPSLRVLPEGGYEGGAAMRPQGHPGPWGESVEELIVAKVG